MTKVWWLDDDKWAEALAKQYLRTKKLSDLAVIKIAEAEHRANLKPFPLPNTKKLITSLGETIDVLIDLRLDEFRKRLKSEIAKLRRQLLPKKTRA